MSSVEVSEIERWQGFLQDNLVRITLRLNVSSPLITSLFSARIIDGEDMQTLEHIYSTEKKASKMVMMWSRGAVLDKIQTLIDVLKKDRLGMESVAQIIEEFQKPQVNPQSEERSVHNSNILQSSPRQVGEAPSAVILPKADSVPTVDATTTGGASSDPETQVPQPGGGIATNNVSVGRDAVFKVSSNSHKFDIQNANFYAAPNQDN